MKKLCIISTVIAALCICVGSYYYIPHSLPTLQSSPCSNIFNEAEKKLSAIEDSIWTELKPYGLEKSNVLQEAHRRASYGYSPVQSVSKDTEKFVTSLIHELGFKDKNIRISGTSLPELVFIEGNKMVINETLFNRYSLPAREFMIAHELAHVFYLDTFVKNILGQTCGNDVIIAEKRPDHPICKFSRFTEWRADLWACKQDTRFIKGYEAFWREVHKTLKPEKPDVAKTHPKRADRLTLAQQLNNPTSPQTFNILTV